MLFFPVHNEHAFALETQALCFSVYSCLCTSWAKIHIATIHMYKDGAFSDRKALTDREAADALPCTKEAYSTRSAVTLQCLYVFEDYCSEKEVKTDLQVMAK